MTSILELCHAGDNQLLPPIGWGATVRRGADCLARRREARAPGRAFPAPGGRPSRHPPMAGPEPVLSLTYFRCRTPLSTWMARDFRKDPRLTGTSAAVRQNTL